MMFESYPDVLTVRQLANALGIGLNSAYSLVNNNEIASKKVGKRILVPKVCLIDYINSCRTEN